MTNEQKILNMLLRRAKTTLIRHPELLTFNEKHNGKKMPADAQISIAVNTLVYNMANSL